MARTLNQYRRTLKKALRSGGNVEDFFVDQKKASKRFDRALRASTRYDRAKKVNTAKSRIKSYTQAQLIWAKWRKAENEMNTFLQSHPELNNPKGMQKLLKDKDFRKEYARLASQKARVHKDAELAKLVYPKLWGTAMRHSTKRKGKIQNNEHP